jgi:hypothetical protein
MKLKEKISIYEFDGKHFQTRMVEPSSSNLKKALITHYLHNIDNVFSKKFKNEAEKAIKDYVLYKNEVDNVSLVSEDVLQQFLFEVNDVPFPTPENYTFKFIDLFAGIGGFRIAMQNLGGKCVFTSEWDKEAQKTYRANFGEVPFGDITKEQTKEFIPDGFDVLWCFDAFQYAIDPIKTLSQWRNIATKGAMLVIGIPQTVAVQQRQLSFHLKPGCFYHHSLVSLIHMLSLTGWDCNTGFFHQRPNHGWIYAVAYKSDHQPLDPRSTNWYNLAELNLLPESAVRSIKAHGYLRQQDLLLPWLDKSFTSMANQ